MSAPILLHPTSATTSTHEDELINPNTTTNSNSNSNTHQQSKETNNSINSSQTRRYRDWIKRTQHIIDSRVATRKDPGWDPILEYHIADIEEDLDRWDRFAQQRENLKTIEIKNEEAMDNGVKALISALSASAVAAITCIYDPDKLAIATLVATLAPICVAIYFLTKSSRTRIQHHQEQVTHCLRLSSIAARRKIKMLSHQLHQQWNNHAPCTTGSTRVSVEERMNPSSPAINHHPSIPSPAVNYRHDETNDDNYLIDLNRQHSYISSITDKHPSPPLRQTSSGATLPLSMENPERHSSKPYDDVILRKNLTLSKPNSYDGLGTKTESSDGGRSIITDVHERSTRADVHGTSTITDIHGRSTRTDVHIDIIATADATNAANAANIPTRSPTTTPTPESQSRGLNL